MPRWRLSLPPPAAPTLPSRLHRSSSPIAVDLPSRSPLMSSCKPSHHPSPPTSRHAVHCHRATPSITVEEPSIAFNPSTAFKSPSLRPLMPITVELSLCHLSSSHRAVHHHQVPTAPSFAVHRCCNHSPSASHSRHPLPSIATNKPSRLPSPSSCHRAVHHSPSLSIAVHHCCDRSPSP